MYIKKLIDNWVYMNIMIKIYDINTNIGELHFQNLFSNFIKKILIFTLNKSSNIIFTYDYQSWFIKILIRFLCIILYILILFR